MTHTMIMETHAKNIFIDCNDEEAVILNGLTVFWTAMKYSDIKERRMRWLANHYDGHVADQYNVPVRPVIVYHEDEKEYEDDDVKHYRILRDKYAMIAAAHAAHAAHAAQIHDDECISESYLNLDEGTDNSVSDYDSIMEDDDYDLEYDNDYIEESEYEDDDYDF